MKRRCKAMRRDALLGAGAGALLAVILAISLSTGRADVTQDCTDGLAYARGLQNFTGAIYVQTKGTTKNYLISPLSISLAFSMLTEGAAATTKQQLLTAISLPVVDAARRTSAAGLINCLAAVQTPSETEGGSPTATLQIADGIFVERTMPLLPSYLAVVQGPYQGTAESKNFTTAPEASRKEINDWVAAKTRQLIQDLLPLGSITSATRLVIANALYFKGLWLTKFDKSMTTGRPFFETPTTAKLVETMGKDSGTYGYLALPDFGAELVDLPFRSAVAAQGAMSMLVLLPARTTTLAAVLARLGAAAGPAGNFATQLSALAAGLAQARFGMYLPKFKAELSTPLPAAIKALGATDAFAPDRADLSGIADPAALGGERLYVTDAFHKAYADVNEEGVEAAAATAIVVGLTSAPAEPPSEVHVDRPFLYALRHVGTNAILFVGTVESLDGTACEATCRAAADGYKEFAVARAQVRAGSTGGGGATSGAAPAAAAGPLALLPTLAAALAATAFAARRR